MKAFLLLTSLYLSFSFFASTAKEDSNNPSEKEVPEVQKLERAPNLFQSEDLFFSGQPSLETLEWMKGQGLDLVINLRSESENEDFAESAFNEEKRVKEMGIKYLSIPIDGYDAYTPENLEKLAKALNGKYNKALIHCASCGRVSYFMMAYLVDYKNYDMAEAVAFGEQLKFRFPLEYLLEGEVDWQLK